MVLKGYKNGRVRRTHTYTDNIYDIAVPLKILVYIVFLKINELTYKYNAPKQVDFYTKKTVHTIQMIF